jgi:hypothetical protein
VVNGGGNGRRVGNGVGNRGQTGRRGASGARSGNRNGTRVVAGARNRSPRNGNVVGYAARRPTLRSRPIVINNNYNNGGRRGGGRYTTYRGRHNYGRQHIYGSHFYFPGYSTFNVGIGYGSGYRYDPYWHGSYGQSYGYDAYGYQSSRNDYYTGSLRLKVQPRFGEVFVDGYYVGLVNDYDGIFQQLRLEEGPHHIEITEAGFVPLEFDVLILPGEKITYEGYLNPL